MNILLPINQYFLRLFKNKFINHKVLFAGNMRDKMPIYLDTLVSFINTHRYDYYIWLKKIVNRNIYYGIMNENIYKKYNFNVLIFFWLKNKKESIFILKNILSLFTFKSEIYVIGANKSGIKNIKNIKELEMIYFEKIINIRKHIIFYAILKKKISFNINDYWNYYYYENFKIYNLPGVFGGNKFDSGSKFLISTIFNNLNIKGKVLDLGCGSGVISTILSNNIRKHRKKFLLYSTDIDIKAIISTKKTLNTNFLENNNVFPSNVYSKVNQKFDFIISNPPIHDDLYYSLKFIYQMINKFKNKTKYNGKLLFVINNFVLCSKIFNKFLFKFDILSKNKNFSVYSIKNINN
ncbi:methyltransferase [Enterobacteriaceae endosymbiont of Donacia versicolorea]|uniref:methyltransferase n=1 Tax=Enterobacteriaceae endosymbiont of Donacia versicolorea TaxID=2675788 RepID=UPI001449F71E|nr:methyltransferase [Enterobacteriaceae endosymbiont of Donacia versicolorea]QJC32027.1 methyltransferase [Enterobacteriaceae endosymbiont of Donacia versicolorea]